MASQGASYYWEMNDASGGAVATIGGLDLSDVGSPEYLTDAVVKTGIHLPAGTHYLQSAATTAMNFVATQGFSYSWIMKLDATSTSSPWGIISKRTNGTTNRNFGAFTYTGGNLFFDLGNNQQRWTSSFIPDADIWYHLAFTWAPGDSRMRLYVNGVMTSTTTAYSPTNSGGNAPFYVGVLGGTSSATAAIIDEVAVFMNKTLTAAEVLAQYATAFPITKILNGSTWADADRKVIA